MQILIILILLACPVSAEQKTILIKRGRPKKQALLDYQFLFMEEKQAFKASPSSDLRGNSIPRSSKTLNTLSQPLALKPKLIRKTQTTITAKHDKQRPDIYQESDWDDYAVESDEELGVQAWITNLQE